MATATNSLAISVRYRVKFFKRHGTRMVRVTMWVNRSRKKTHCEFTATPRVLRRLINLFAEPA